MTQIQNVQDTAFWVATYRADESESPNPLFHDPLARKLTGERGKKIANAMPGGKYTAWSVVTRTCIIDSQIQELLKEKPDTVLNLGAGLDTRPYRLSLPKDLRWVEVDYPAMIRHKNEILKDDIPGCRLERIELDLSDEKSRQEFFKKAGAEYGKTLVLTEGVIPYLTEAQVATLGRDLRQQKNFRYWIADYFSPQLIEFVQKRRKKQMKNAPFQFKPRNWFFFFSELGWQAREVRFMVEESEKHGRKVPNPWWARVLQIFASKERRESYRKMAGYVILEPI